MKTLIFNGSPRNTGDTMTLVNEFIKQLDGEYIIVNAYDCNIKPCIDCRYCRKNNGCSQNDKMQDIYNYITEFDNILVASPIYFSELTGPLLSVMSRLQTYWCARFFRNAKPIDKIKKGGILLVGGGDGSMKKVIDTAECLLNKDNLSNFSISYYSYTLLNL